MKTIFQTYTFEILNQLWFVVHSYQSLGKHSFFLGVKGLDTEEKRHFPVTGPPPQAATSCQEGQQVACSRRSDSGARAKKKASERERLEQARQQEVS